MESQKVVIFHRLIAMERHVNSFINIHLIQIARFLIYMQMLVQIQTHGSELVFLSIELWYGKIYNILKSYIENKNRIF